MLPLAICLGDGDGDGVGDGDLEEFSPSWMPFVARTSSSELDD